MGTQLLGRYASKIAIIAIAASASASLCSAQETAARPAQTVTAGQGGYVVLPDLRPAPASYALTGEENQKSATLRAWQAQAGPVLFVGNARIIVPPTR